MPSIQELQSKIKEAARERDAQEVLIDKLQRVLSQSGRSAQVGHMARNKAIEAINMLYRETVYKQNLYITALNQELAAYNRRMPIGKGK